MFCLGIYSADKFMITPMSLQGSDPAYTRNLMTRAALQLGAEWLLFVDADMQVEPDFLERAVAHDKDIVGADYRKRLAPYEYVGLPHIEGEVKGRPTTGLVEYDMLGLGFLLVRRCVLEALPSPWFKRYFDPRYREATNPDGFITEDSVFCINARANGFKIWCDLDMTKQIKHLGEQIVGWDI